MAKKVQKEDDYDLLTPEEISKIELRKKIEELRKASDNRVPIIVTKSGEAKRADKLNIEEQTYEYYRCKTNPIYFIETYLTVFDQTKGKGGEIVPFKLFEFQKNLIKSYLGFDHNITNKYRQGGASTVTCAYIAWYIMFQDNRSVAVIANKLQTAKDELLYDVVNFISNSPSFLRPKIGDKDAKDHKSYSNGSQVKAFAPTKINGITPTLLFWDEVAHTENGENFWTSAKPTLGTGGKSIFVSTPQGLDKVFYENYTQAIKGENHFHANELYWYNDPRFNKDLYWVKNEGLVNEFKIIDEDFSFEKRKQFIADGFKPLSPWFVEARRGYNGNMKKLAQELELSFLGSGNNFFAEEYIKRIEEKHMKSPIAEEWEDKNMWIWEMPMPTFNYILSVDVSSGHGEDFSTINILKIIDYKEKVHIHNNGKLQEKTITRRKTEQVAQYNGKVTPQYLAQIVYKFGMDYNQAYVVIDVNGLGMGTMEKLIEFGYPLKSIHYSEVNHKPTRDRLSGYIKTSQKEVSPGNFIKVDLIPGFLISSVRGMVLHEIERAVRTEDIIIHSSRTTKEMKTFENKSNGRIAEARRSFHDDDILSLAMGQYVCAFDMIKGLTSDEKVKAMLDSIMVLGVNDNIQPDEIKKREAGDVRPHGSNPYGQHSWLLDREREMARRAAEDEKRRENEEKLALIKANPNSWKYL